MHRGRHWVSETPPGLIRRIQLIWGNWAGPSISKHNLGQVHSQIDSSFVNFGSAHGSRSLPIRPNSVGGKSRGRFKTNVAMNLINFKMKIGGRGDMANPRCRSPESSVFHGPLQTSNPGGFFMYRVPGDLATLSDTKAMLVPKHIYTHPSSSESSHWR